MLHLIYYAACTLCTQVDEQKVDKGESAGPRLLGAEAALRVVAEQLPKIVPNMLINKRDGEGLCGMFVATRSWVRSMMYEHQSVVM